MTGAELLAYALRAHRAGLCVVPPREDGSKAPIGEWKQYQKERPTEEEIKHLYANGRSGIGFIPGSVSGGLEIIESDEGGIYEAFRDRARSVGLGELVERIEFGYSEESPSGGIHLGYRCSTISGNQKLAQRPRTREEIKRSGDAKPVQVLIETRGEGGFIIAAPSSGRVHPSGRPYRLLRGSVETIATITPEEREALFDLARTFDELPRREQSEGSPKARANGGLRPGDDFNARATWPEVLEPHGWRRVFESGGESYWRRPGKAQGISATSNYKGSDLFYCFSTSTTFESERGYDKFGAYAVLEHAGNLEAAARALRGKGFGAPPEPSSGERGEGSAPERTAGAFFGEQGFIPARVGALLKAEAHLALGEDDRLYRYHEGVYVPDGDAYVRARQRELLGDKFKKRHLDEVLAWLRAEAASIPARPPEPLLNVRNGLLDWRTGEPLPHSPEHKSAIQIPVEWHPHACCPAIEAFLEQVLPDEETVELVLEIIGYSLLANLLLHVAVLLLGPGRNGKSVLLAIIRALLGSANVASVPLQLFSESRFAAAALYGKLANVCGDLDARAIERTDVFKMMTGGDAIHAERKYGHPFAFVSFALPIFSANEVPYSKDQTDAWFERWLVIPMQRVIPLEGRDPNLVAKLTSQAELEGLLVRAVEGLRRLMERGRFELPAAVREAGRGYREQLDTVAGWLADCCDLRDPQAITARADLYASYRRWCEANGHRFPLRAPAVYDRLRRHPEAQEVTIHGVRGFRGVKLA